MLSPSFFQDKSFVDLCDPVSSYSQRILKLILSHHHHSSIGLAKKLTNLIYDLDDLAKQRPDTHFEVHQLILQCHELANRRFIDLPPMDAMITEVTYDRL